MDHKEFLENQRNEYTKRWESNRDKAKILMEQKTKIDGMLQLLVNEGSMLAAKMAAINEMLKE